MTPDEQIEKLRAQLAAAQAELRGIRDDAGTPLAISDGLWKFAEEECGHNPLSARPALLTVIDWVQKAKAELAEARAELAEARLDTERWDFVARHIEALVDGPGNKFGLEFSLNYEANASYRQRVREHIDAAREKEQKCQSKS